MGRSGRGPVLVEKAPMGVMSLVIKLSLCSRESSKSQSMRQGGRKASQGGL